MRTLWNKPVGVVLCLALSFLAACDGFDLSFLFVKPASADATRTQSVTLSDGAVVVVNNDNGSTRVTVDPDATKATIKMTRVAYATDETTADTLLDSITVTITEPNLLNNTLTIDAPCPEGATDDENNFTADVSADSMDVTSIFLGQQVAVVRLVITLPPDCDLQIVQKNGAIRVTGLDSTGVLTVENGTVRVLESTGDVTVRTTDGQVEVSDHEGSLDAVVENGAISVDILSLASSEEIQCGVTNGQIALSAPADLDAYVIAEADKGTVVFSSSGFDDVSDVTQTLNSLTATLNSGGPQIELQAGNGLITILGN